ncbi:hypothetical protein A1O1_06477 [Capronia coronata CBS 617.96]|uniref:Uncharacterized protein n=1 Tax=Capronia coronata CBS 617.96 TaxID=1182541 RepID=W9Y0U0_9EURO|nr:uncharacterized protein A1O1_06477 [Capronia coronata CBS 617.96]EXJ86108.1 hypothetical protein A1O1_06477 [Capronia coronata CBS 617.96]
MSVTTTANPVSGAVLQALTDYDIHHSGNPEQPRTPEPPNPQRETPVSAENPPNWDREHRRVPPYRPVDRSRLGPERPAGSNVVEGIFIFTMLNGVGLIGNVDTAWRATGGKINSRFFRYKIGGEW